MCRCDYHTGGKYLEGYAVPSPTAADSDAGDAGGADSDQNRYFDGI